MNYGQVNGNSSRPKWCRPKTGLPCQNYSYVTDERNLVMEKTRVIYIEQEYQVINESLN